MWVATPALGQALVPHTVEDPARLAARVESGTGSSSVSSISTTYEMVATGTAGNQLAPKSFQSWFLLGGLTNKFNEAIAACNRRDRYNPKKPQFYSLWVKQTQEKSTTRRFNQAGLKKPNDPEGLLT